MSRDGERRVSFRLDFRLDKVQMVTLLAMHGASYGDIGEELTEQTAMGHIKDQLRYQGMDVLDFGSDADNEDALEWAKEQVEKLWKES
jgi:hypothetical protein